MSKHNPEKYKKFYEDNKERIKDRTKKYYKENKENKKFKDRINNFYKNNKEKINKQQNSYYHAVSKVNPLFRLKRNLRKQVYGFLLSNKKHSTFDLIGCDLDFLRNHLEKQFIENMSWENYGKWQVDHIIPCSSFNLLNVEEQRKCFHWTNLRPLWSSENIRKKDKLPDDITFRIWYEDHWEVVFYAA